MPNKDQETKTIDKGLIFMKSTVIALFIILVTLVIVLIITKNKKEENKALKVSQCNKFQEILIDNEIDEVEGQGAVLNVVTEFDEKTNSQELIRIDSVCGTELSRIRFKKRGNNE